MSQIRMNASAIGGTLQLPFSGVIQVPSDGIITVDSRDATVLLRQGASYVTSAARYATYIGPIAGAAGQLVASTSFANGTLSIANQPDFPRQASVRIWPGTVAITGGQAAVSYTANDGTTQTDIVSGIGGATTAISVNLSKGVVHLNSVIVTGVAGGATPGIQVDTLNRLAALVDAGFVDFSMLGLSVDNASVGLVTTFPASGVFQPSTVPNGTHSYGFSFKFNAPG
jgi:hypothetical protein